MKNRSLPAIVIVLAALVLSLLAARAAEPSPRLMHKESGIALVLVPAGEFMMGSPESERERVRDRRHKRIIREAFYLGETEVTVGQFRKFVQATGYETDAERGVGEQGRGSFAATPGGDRSWNTNATWRNPFPNLTDYRIRDDHPVVHVSWNDAQKFCEHFKFRLPTEAEWEYACRAGSTNRFPWGETEAGGEGFANVGDQTGRKRFASFNLPFPFEDGAELIAPAGSYKPNAWGLRDMIGNVEEWCEDVFGPYPEDGADETAAKGEGGARVLRGSSWLGNGGNCRASARFGMRESSRRDFEGFRVAATADKSR